MTRSTPILIAVLLSLPAVASLRAQGADYRPGLRSTGGSDLELVSTRSADACLGRAGKVEIGTVAAEEGMVKAAGTWKASPGTDRLAVEVRVDQDRQLMALYEGEAGSWSAEFPFALCGRHMMRVYAFASVPGQGRSLLCFEGAPSTTKAFEIVCTPQAYLDRCAIDCPSPKPAATGKKGKTPPAPPECKATCEASASSGVGTLIGLAGLNNANLLPVEGPEGSTWKFTLACKPGDKVTFLVRDHSGTGATSKPAEKECAPQ